MSNAKVKYISEYNKKTYKMYQFRVNKDSSLIQLLDEKKNRNAYIISLIERDTNSDILKISDIKKILKDVLGKRNINEIYLFGSYARGEQNINSDVDIYCERGDVKSFIDKGILIEELEHALGKKVDLIFMGSMMNEFFQKNMERDLIRLC